MKNIFEEGLLLIGVSIKSHTQPNISKPLGICWTIHILSKTPARFCGTQSTKLTISSRASCNFDFTDLKTFPSGVGRDQAMGPREN